MCSDFRYELGLARNRASARLKQRPKESAEGAREYVGELTGCWFDRHTIAEAAKRVREGVDVHVQQGAPSTIPQCLLELAATSIQLAQVRVGWRRHGGEGLVGAGVCSFRIDSHQPAQI